MEMKNLIKIELRIIYKETEIEKYKIFNRDFRVDV
jgi:hypothetical protein